MKIGILTFHKPINYGAFLQAFSLSQNLKKKFPDDTVEIVDYIAPKEKNKIYLNILRDLKYFGFRESMKSIRKLKVFRAAQKWLPLSKRSFCTTNTGALFSYIDEHYDLLIIGSDAVFNWNQNGYPTAFIPNYPFKRCKIISYAASVHGLKYLKEPSSRIKECGQVFEDMPLVGVRDCNTDQFVHHCCSKAKTMHCCDPTVVIDKEQILRYADKLEERILKKYGCDLSKKYIVLMAPESPLTAKIREKYSGEYQIIALFKPLKDAQFYLYDLNPFEWAAVINKAAVVVTSYFHGTLLALRQSTPVISLDCSGYTDENYEGKLKDLLHTRFQIPEFYFENKELKKEGAITKILSTMEDAIAGNYRDRIERGVRSEAAFFDEFCDSVQKIVSH